MLNRTTNNTIQKQHVEFILINKFVEVIFTVFVNRRSRKKFWRLVIIIGLVVIRLIK